MFERSSRSFSIATARLSNYMIRFANGSCCLLLGVFFFSMPVRSRGLAVNSEIMREEVGERLYFFKLLPLRTADYLLISGVEVVLTFLGGDMLSYSSFPRLN